MEETRRESINKSKRSRSEQINQVMETYLQKRNYPENHPISVPHDQMNLSFLVNGEVSRSNSILYTCYSSDPMVIGHSFSKFVSWVKELHTKSKEYQELDYIIAPLFCHLYIELQQKAHKDAPANFFKFHVPAIDKFQSNDAIKALINAILNDSAECSVLKKNLRTHKYVVNLSSKSMFALKKYLSENNQVVILQILQNWFQINEDESESSGSEMEIESPREKLNGYTPQTKIPTLSMQKLQDAIKAVKSEPGPIYSVNLGNLKDDIDCGLISRELDFAVYSYNSAIYLTSLVTLKQLDYLPEEGDVVIREHSDRIYDFSVMKQNRYLLSASNDKSIKLFDLNTYRLVHTYLGHEYPIYRVATSPNDCYIISGSYDNSCRLWSTESTDTLRLYAGHTQEITALDFHPNSLYFVTGSADKNVRMWTINDASPVRLFLGSKGTIYAAKFSGSGKYLATAGEDKRIRIWDLVNSKQIVEFKTGSEPIIKLAWSGNDNVLCGGNIEGTLKMWDFNEASANLECSQRNYINCVKLNAKLLSLEFAFDTFGCLTSQHINFTYLNL